MLVVIDNYDSFTYNLVQYFGELMSEIETKGPDDAGGAGLKVFRNDQTTLEELDALHPTHLVISPGPCTPGESGLSPAAIRHFSGKIPVLGVCLGHQCIGAVFGGKVVRAPAPVHGKITRISHNGRDLFRGIPDAFEAVRYHSLVVEHASLPESLEITATNETGLIMGLRHRSHPTYGLQFHPESIFTGVGKNILANFLAM